MALLHPDEKIVVKSFDVPYLSADFQPLEKLIRESDGGTRIVMECTGRYYDLIARELSHAVFL